MQFPSPPREYPDSPTVLRELTDGVLLVTFNRPERNNGWTVELEEAYFGTLLAAAEDPEVRVIVVTGAGRSFCPGLDMQVLEDAAKLGKPSGTERRWPMTLPLSIPKPVIAAINGAAAGIGMIQICCADIRFAAKGSKLTTAFARRGLPAENGLSWLLPRLVGVSHAMELLLSSRVFLSEEAAAIGLVNRLYEPEELLASTMEYARDLAANCSPLSMASIKAQVLEDLETGAEESRLSALVRVSEHTQSADFEEGVTSYTERRAPKFPGYGSAVPVTRGWYR